MSAVETDAAFLLRVLSDEKPHTLEEILQASFAERGCGLTVHSRAAELRKRGHEVVNRVSGGVRGRRVSVYRLVKPEPSGAEIRALLVNHPEPCLPEKAAVTEQLALSDSVAAHIFRDIAGTPYA